MLRRDTLRGFVLLLSTLPVTMANSVVGSHDVVRGDVTRSAALEWTLQSEPGRDDLFSFTFNGDNVFRYMPYTGVIPPPILDGNPGNPQYSNATYDPRFAIYNTSTRGVGFRLAGLRREDAGTYTCINESLVQTVDTAVLFVHDFPGRPVVEASPQTFVEGVTNISLECEASSTSLPVAHRPAMLYTWNRNGVDIDRTAPPERHAVLGDSGQTLEISPVHHTDTMYTCTASESGTQLISEETEVTLNILHGPYNLKINPEKPSARENDFLEIKVSADCNPACNYTWSIGDDVISKEPLLRFDKFQSHDANNYTVRAANMYGTADFTVEVTLDTSPGDYTVPGENEFWTTDVTSSSAEVPGRPVIEASPHIFVEGVTNVSLECNVSSTSLPVDRRPAMLYSWTRNGVDIERTGPPARHAVLGDSGQTLKISSVHRTDTTYTCTASENGTNLTSVETEIKLDVLHGPYDLMINPRNPSARESDTLEITASADCNPACNFTWSIVYDVISNPLLKFDTFQSHDANNYTVRAANIYGTADFTVEVTLDTSQAPTPTEDNPSPPEDNFIVIVASAAAGGVALLLLIIVVAVCCARRQRKPASEYVNSEVLGEPDHSTSDYINPDVFRELGQPTGDYITTDVFREPGQPTGDYLTTDVFREPGQPTGDYVNSEICRKPTSAGHPHADASGRYESIDMATREPADPINRVYEALQQ